MPVVKKVNGPDGGGSAIVLADYVLGYTLNEKGTTRADHLARLAEVESRPDKGVGVVFQPSSGDLTRPSSAFAFGVTSLATAGIEMQTLAQASGVDERFAHLVFSFGRDFTNDPSQSRDEVIRQDEIMIEFTRRVLRKMEWESAGVITVHRDTARPHVHVALLMVDPVSLRELNRHFDIDRLHLHTREVELEMGLVWEFGNYTIREEPGFAPRIEKTDRVERWRHHLEHREDDDMRREERGPRDEAEAVQKHDSEEYADYERTFAEYADLSVAPRLREYLAEERDHLWVDAHLAAFGYGVKIDCNSGGLRFVRDGDAIAFEKCGLNSAEVLEKFGGKFEDFPRSQKHYRDLIESNPASILAEVTQREARFGRDTIKRELAYRLPQWDDLEQLSAKVLHDPEVIALRGSLDVPFAIFTTRQMQRMEAEIMHLGDTLASARDDRYDAQVLARCVAEVERSQKARDPKYSLSEEQYGALSHLDRRLSVVQGLPGVGKTDVLEVIRRYADATQRKIIGLTIQQSASEELFARSGIHTYNTALAEILEGMGQRIIPNHGIVVIDEAGMVGHQAMRKILEVAESRDCTVISTGDVQQMQPIDAGGAFRLLHECAKRNGTYEELRDIRRQQAELRWMRDPLRTIADAIDQRDEGLFLKALRQLEGRGVLEWVDGGRTAVLERAAALQVDQIRWFGERGARLLAPTRDKVRHSIMALRRALGLMKIDSSGREQAGHSYSTVFGKRQFTVGDRIIFRSNASEAKGLLRSRSGFAAKITNGEVGTVVKHERYRLTIDLDRGERVSFDPRKYQSFDWGWGITTIRAQGLSVDSCIVVADRATSAELLFTGLSRGSRFARIVLSRADFGNLEDLAHHLVQRISLKATAYHVEDEISQYGSYDLRHFDPDDPTWKRYQQAMSERFAAGLRIATVDLRERYKVRFGANWERGHLREFLREADGILKKHAPTPFGKWCAEQRRAETAYDNMREPDLKQRPPTIKQQLGLGL